MRKPLSFHITQALLGPSLDLSPGQTSPSEFAQLLASTDGWCSASVRIKRSGASEDPIGAVAAKLRASVVERSAGAASLHAVAGAREAAASCGRCGGAACVPGLFSAGINPDGLLRRCARRRVVRSVHGRRRVRAFSRADAGNVFQTATRETETGYQIHGFGEL